MGTSPRSKPCWPRVVNAGGVGMPYEHAPGAYWVLLGEGIEHRHTAYDLEEAAAMIRHIKQDVEDE